MTHFYVTQLKTTKKTKKFELHKNWRTAYGNWGGQHRKPFAHYVTTAAAPGWRSLCTLVVPLLPTSCTMVPYISTATTRGTRYCPHPWDGVITLRARGSATATRNVPRVPVLDWRTVCPPHGRGSPSSRSCARRGIILETLSNFHDYVHLLVRTLSEDRFCCFVLDHRIECHGWLFKKGRFVATSANEYCTGANGRGMRRASSFENSLYFYLRPFSTWLEF